MPIDKQKQELIDKFNRIFNDFAYTYTRNLSEGKQVDYLQLEYAENVADIIIEDRKRIVEPLVKYNRDFNSKGKTSYIEADKAIDQTLRNAGIGK